LQASSFIYAYTEWRFYTDGNLLEQIPLANAQTGNIQPTNSALSVGGRSSGGSPLFNSDIAEIILLDQTLSDTDRQLIEEYLGAKYGITVP